jgi:hypothetical protein
MTARQLPSLLLPASHGGFPVPAIIADAGDKTAEHFLEFFPAAIRNPNTRAAVLRNKVVEKLTLPLPIYIRDASRRGLV